MNRSPGVKSAIGSPMKYLVALLLVGFTPALPQGGGHLIENPLRDIPKWVRNEFSAQHLDRKYSMLFRLFPHCLRGDFNGDGKKDAAVQIEETSSGKLGIAIFHAKRVQALFVPVTVLGAGKPVGKAGDDFKWADVWSVVNKARAQNLKLPDIQADAIRLEKRKGKGGIIYREGTRYTWYPLSK
ncbi:MAG TPA: hypothetical protein VES59_00855 [Bacteroidota bacterium]|nr:hypothetical protein [Bacteroidota bacterium]